MSTAKPLSGIRVLDFTRVLAGPFATALLGDLGAEIVKVEPPQGDEYRHIGVLKDGYSALFLLMNRNKKSIVIDLKKSPRAEPCPTTGRTLRRGNRELQARGGESSRH